MWQDGIFSTLDFQMQAGKQDEDRLLNTVDHFDFSLTFSGQFSKPQNWKMFSVEDRTEQAS